MIGPIEESGNSVKIKKSVQTRKYWSFLKKCAMHILYLSLFFGLVFYLKHETSSIKNISQISIGHEADILTALNDLSVKIDKLSADHAQITELKTQLGHLEQTMVTEQSLSSLAKSSELQKVATQLNQLMHPTNNPKFHRASSHFFRNKPLLNVQLPFQVLSVDSMAGQAYTSVQYHQNTVPLRLNDQLAGWKAVHLDSLAGIVVWENPQRRRITTTMREMVHA